VKIPAALTVAAAFTLGGSAVSATARSLPLKLVANVPLPGPSNRFDYTSLDPTTNRLYIAHMDAGELLVFDTTKRRVIRTITALAGCNHDHGLLVDAPHRLAFVACDGNARLLTLDLTRMKVTGSASVGASPDVLAFDTTLERLYVSSEIGDVTVLAERGRRLVKLGQSLLAPFAHTVAVDPRTHLVYFPLQSGSSGRPQLRIMAPTSR
jgi:DNA-binding beta-propeller fold protein YncE